MEVREVATEDREWVEELVASRWGARIVVNRGRARDATLLPGLVAEVDGERLGLLTYEVGGRLLEVVTIDALRQGEGIGTALLARVREIAMSRGCVRIWLTTTNDNLDAIAFYQRRGFRMVAVHPGAVDTARVLKPGIPFAGARGIPVRDEIELSLAIAPPFGPTSDEMEVSLDRIAATGRSELAKLFQLYLHDFSSIRPMRMSDDVTFTYRYFDAIFTEPERRAWFIRHGGRLAGFAVTREVDGRIDMAEFFVMRAHRRAGVGRRAAALVFAAQPGPWDVRFDVANGEAAAFWPDVVAEAADGELDRVVLGPPEQEVVQVRLRFSTGPVPAPA